jgi:hypothetical protein
LLTSNTGSEKVPSDPIEVLFKKTELLADRLNDVEINVATILSEAKNTNSKISMIIDEQAKAGKKLDIILQEYYLQKGATNAVGWMCGTLIGIATLGATITGIYLAFK